MLEKAKRAKRDALEKEKLLKTVMVLKELDKQKTKTKKSRSYSSDSSSSSSSSSDSGDRYVIKNIYFFLFYVHNEVLIKPDYI